MPYPVPSDFQIDPASLGSVGSGLRRPECVVPLPDGRVMTSYGPGGYSLIAELEAGGDGTTTTVAPTSSPASEFLANAVAPAPDGTVWFTNLATPGGVFRLDAAGAVSDVWTTIDAEPIPPSNFLMVEPDGTVWLTVSTRTVPRSSAWGTHVADGFIAVRDRAGARIVADNLGYTNEIAFTPDRRWLYVNETYHQRVSRFRVLPGNILGERETILQLTGADLPDGLAFDSDGGLWITCIGSNRIMLLRPNGELDIVLDGGNEAAMTAVTAGLATASLTQTTLDAAGHAGLGNISSIGFGGPDGHTAYLGSLLTDHLWTFRTAVRAP